MKTFAMAACVALLATTAMAATPNTLTASETAAGWRLLFDGKSTAGWRGFKTAEPDAGWTAKGELSPDPKVSKDIMTKDSFENFDLSFEWKISPKGNSGVMFHVTEAGNQTYESGPEYQVLDNSRGEPPLEQAGGLFALYAPEGAVTKPVGEFNQARLIVNHGKVEHWLNGVKVAAYDLNSADFKARVAASKFKAWPPFAASPTGHIALQNHGDAVAFRSLKIRVLK
ncbi:MAG: DUF1080 domain-containing protein [Alphaproteobacteria bacterium]|nr:DUF1080 domain-containing protein [Alphaproteobacteria bacterium]MBU1516904.1 DUF1080 domain-containing protein [Alphaproteobacteria bacterium]MBU2092599.1 DUF1080 domain-containing protein [Alphaproteobacteria bacterium]MBU2151290.1 DUF1080 domain-containing protein [Alphaproteobacteria bacterium]MBU2309592.1 DUF1080 domain-containing protein [Alphaproteobacteria bacterium]